jgi:hypothetical protein
MGVCAFFVLRQVPALAAGPLIAAAVILAASFFYPHVVRNKTAMQRHPHRYAVGMGILMGATVIAAGGGIAYLVNVAVAALGGHAPPWTALAMRMPRAADMLMMGSLHGAFGGFAAGLVVSGGRLRPPSE